MSSRSSSRSFATLVPTPMVPLLFYLIGLSLSLVSTQSAPRTMGKLQAHLPLCGEGRVFGANGQSKVTLCFGASAFNAQFAEIQDQFSRTANEQTQRQLREMARQANVVSQPLSSAELGRFASSIAERLAATMRESNAKLTGEIERLNSGFAAVARLMELQSSAAAKNHTAPVLGAAQVDALVKLEFSRFEQSMLLALEPIAAATARTADAVSQLPNQADEAIGLRAEKAAMRSDLELFRSLSGPTRCSRLDGDIGRMLKDIEDAETRGRFAGARLAVQSVREQLRRGVSQLQLSEMHHSSEQRTYQDAVMAAASALSRLESRTRDLERQAAKRVRGQQRLEDLRQRKVEGRRTSLQARIDLINGELQELRNGRPTEGATRVSNPQASDPVPESAPGEAATRTRPSGFGSSKDKLTDIDRKQAALSDKLAQDTLDTWKKARIAKLEADLAKSQSDLATLEDSPLARPTRPPEAQSVAVQGEEAGHRPTRAQRIEHGHAAQQVLKGALDEAAELTRTGQFGKAGDKLYAAIRDASEVEAGRPALSHLMPLTEAARISRAQICD